MSTNTEMPPAVILAGGRGARLSPLTDTTPKPLLPLAGKPILFWILDRLAAMGVRQAYVMTGYLSEKIVLALEGYTGKIRVTCCEEPKPLGSAGCLSLLPESIVSKGCLVVSGDAYFEFDLRGAVRLQQKKDAAAVLCLHEVSHPLAFGLVQTASDGRVEAFVEKPTWSGVQGDLASTGIYVLSAETVAQIRLRKGFLDFGADVFPRLLASGKRLYGHVPEGFWCDIGTPDAYRLCNLRLSGNRSVLGAGVELANDARLSGCVLLDGVQVGQGVRLRDCIVGEHTILGRGVTVEPGAVLGASVVAADNSRIGAQVLVSGGTIVPAGTMLLSDFDPDVPLRFEGGRMTFGVLDAKACGKRLGRAMACLAGDQKTVALMRQTRSGQSDFWKGLCGGVLEGGSHVCDCGWGFLAKARFAAVSGRYAYTLFVAQNGDHVVLDVFDENGLCPDARFERRLCDLLRALPSPSSSRAELTTEKQIDGRYLLSLRLLTGGKNSLSGMTVWVTGEDDEAVQMLERVLYSQGALLSRSAQVVFRLSKDATEVTASVMGLEMGYWQIFMLLALEHVVGHGRVMLPYVAPEQVKQQLLAAGARPIFYTLYPESPREEAIRAQLVRTQPWAVDGIAACAALCGMLASGKLRAAQIRLAKERLAVCEEALVVDDTAKLHLIKAHKREFDGEGLLCRYPKGNVRVLANANGMKLQAEAAHMTDAKALLGMIKKEIFPDSE